MKKKAIIILILLVISLLLGSLYGTFATDSTVDTVSSSTYAITLSNDSNVSVPAKSSKTIIYKLCNTNKGVVKYGIGYSGTNINVKVYEDSTDEVAGLINYGENKFIKLYIENTGNTESIVSINTVLGYEHGGELIVPNNISLVTEKYKGTISRYITNLYKNAPKTVVTNNNITYNYATTVSLMNDRFGGTSSLDGGNIRYYGANPNNYIDIGDRDSSNNVILYRIIGLFKNVTLEDGTKKDLIKVIRNESIGNYSWDTSETSVNSGYGINEWSQADAMKLLNPGYESESVGGSLFWNSKSGVCYNGYSNNTTTCNFTSTGLSNNAKNNIETVVWNTGGYNSAEVYSNEIYIYEREKNVVIPGTTCSGAYCNDKITRNTNWTGKIALMYSSDYGYATDFAKCTQDLNNYNSSNDSYACRSNNWLYNNSSLRLLTSNSSDGINVWRITSDGTVSHLDSGAYGRGLLPTFYLKDDIIIESGDGTKSNPYVIG